MRSIEIERAHLEIPKNITLADPEFYNPSEIDLLIGVKLFYKLLCVGQISLEKHPNAVLQKTQFGWIVPGEINGSPPKDDLQCHLLTHSNPLDANLNFPPQKYYQKWNRHVKYTFEKIQNAMSMVVT